MIPNFPGTRLPNINGIINTLSTIFPNAAMDVVGVFTQDLVQVFRNARPLKVNPKPMVKLMEQPIETGVVITDHRILLPIEIELTLIFRGTDYRDTYNEIWELKNKSTILTVQTMERTFENMVIIEMPSEESVNIFNTITMALKLKEVIFANTETKFAPKNPTKSNTVDRGQVQPAPATPNQSGAAEFLFGRAK